MILGIAASNPSMTMGIFSKPKLKSGLGKKKDMPEGLWQKCPACGEVIHRIELEQNNRVCPKCQYHFPLSSSERIKLLTDKDSFVERDADLQSCDPLGFTGVAAYTERLETYMRKTGMNDAVICGRARLAGMPYELAVMDFAFLAATMGSVVGEKITRSIEAATADKVPMVIISASGGARMYEGMLSLMQMAKTCGALAHHAEAKLPYISILTNPTTAGVMASYASIGDLILAEPGCMIGFAGPRVIRETTHQELPEGFQTSEFLLERGLLDRIVHRNNMRRDLENLMHYLTPARG